MRVRNFWILLFMKIAVIFTFFIFIKADYFDETAVFILKNRAGSLFFLLLKTAAISGLLLLN
jgi:hypothetical protein